MPAATGRTEFHPHPDVEVIVQFDNTSPNWQLRNNPAVSYRNDTDRPIEVWVYLNSNPATPLTFAIPQGTGSATRSDVSAATGGAVTGYLDCSWTFNPDTLP